MTDNDINEGYSEIETAGNDSLKETVEKLVPFEKFEEKQSVAHLYLIDDHLLTKFSNFLNKDKINLEFLTKLKNSPLVYGKRFYPINDEELQAMKSFVELSLSQKNVITTTTTTTTPTTTITTTTTTTTTPAIIGPVTSSTIAGPVTPSETETFEPPAVEESILPGANNILDSSVVPKSHLHIKVFSWKPTKWDKYKILKRK